MPLSTVPDAVVALQIGRAVIVADDELRENEGDVVFAASLATPALIAWVVRNSSGFICAPMTGDIADRLELPLMVEDNQDPRGTAYTVTVDAANRLATGISATDRAHTLRVLGDPSSTPDALHRPGHILPLRAVGGGVLQRAGHTEAAVDLMKLAGLPLVAGIAEIVGADGEMERLPGLLALGERDDVPVITVAQLVSYLAPDAP
jgi:3,4-dihydroxy 2-butanone 4-phosphate synthase/GTP cyclohydrolase II